jgi:hydrogenase maturation factor
MTTKISAKVEELLEAIEQSSYEFASIGAALSWIDKEAMGDEVAALRKMVAELRKELAK